LDLKYFEAMQGGQGMRAIVDPDICFGCTLCTQVCPGVFHMEGDKAKVYIDPVPPAMENDCRQAAEQCPVSAIKVI